MVLSCTHFLHNVFLERVRVCGRVRRGDGGRYNVHCPQRRVSQSQAAVRQKQAAFLNQLLELGVAGFRLDSAKHMWPRDLAAIQALLNDTQFGARPFFLHHVIDLGHGAVRVGLRVCSCVTCVHSYVRVVCLCVRAHVAYNI